MEQEDKTETIKDAMKKQGINSLDDERLKFIPKKERKAMRGFLKQTERTRRATQVVFKGLYLNRSLRGGGLVMHIPKERIPEDGLHLTISNEDMIEYLEDGSPNIKVFEVIKGEDAPEQKTT